jgi:hypothetical protein
MVIDPHISLAIDNCFASKRWTQPQDWMYLIKEMGITLVEASADTECDPLYMGEAYIQDWIRDVKKWSDRSGVRVVNVYSGHGTYTTLGLAHTDARVRVRFRDQWLKAHANTARHLDAGLGFFAHAISDPVLQDPGEYQRSIQVLYDGLANLAEYASEIGLSSIGVEQMYSPHQPPWTIKGAKELLAAVNRMAQAPFYLTLDVGHMNGQQFFYRPSPEKIAHWIDCKAAGQPAKRIWLGPHKAMEIFRKSVSGEIQKTAAIEQIQALWEDCGYFFAGPEDGSVHTWLQELAGYSPIIHLQQSDGKSSPHWPFSPEHNEKGIIHAEEVFRDIARAYEKDAVQGLPPLCSEIILTLEPFISTAGNNTDAIEEIAQSVQYWRQYISRDGMRLSEVLKTDRVSGAADRKIGLP